MQARSAARSPSGTARLAAAIALVACLIGVTVVSPVRAHAATQQQMHKHLRGHAVLVAASADTFQPPLRPDVHLIAADRAAGSPATLSWPANSDGPADSTGRSPLVARTRGPPVTAN